LGWVCTEMSMPVSIAFRPPANIRGITEPRY
jgi:hypothetical protein